MEDIEYRSFPAPDELTDELRGWFHAVGLGFVQGVASEESVARWHEEVARDRFRFEGAYASSTTAGLGADVPVGTFGTTTQTINTGGGHLEPACFITDVTVRATHRRRGVLTRMMGDALRRARDEGLTLAALTVSEGGIYGRFGFGVATARTSAQLATGAAFALLHPAEPRVEYVTPEASVGLRRAVFDRFHATHRGSHARLAFYDAFLSGAWDQDTGAPKPGMRSVVHLAPDGTPDGVVAYEYDRAESTLRVRDLLALDATAELGLWQFLASIDLVEKVVTTRLSPTSALPWALRDPRVLSVTDVTDFTWLRVLDTPGALRARAFEADGEAFFTVVDAQEHASGSWRLVVRDGRAEVAPAASEPSVRLQARALGSLYLGLADARRLAASGLVGGPSADVAGLAALFRTAEPPHNAAGF